MADYAKRSEVTIETMVSRQKEGIRPIQREYNTLGLVVVFCESCIDPLSFSHHMRLYIVIIVIMIGSIDDG